MALPKGIMFTLRPLLQCRHDLETMDTLLPWPEGPVVCRERLGGCSRATFETQRSPGIPGGRPLAWRPPGQIPACGSPLPWVLTARRWWGTDGGYADTAAATGRPSGVHAATDSGSCRCVAAASHATSGEENLQQEYPCW